MFKKQHAGLRKKNINNTHFSATASRTSGVAPLSVHFTAGFNSSATGSRDFHDLDYTWSFGDPGSGNWGTNGKSKNTAKGPVAVHIFENPGTYTVNLAVSDGASVVYTESFTIEVDDPDRVYNGALTVCVADVDDFAGCPGGAQQVITENLSAIPAYIEAGARRVLFRRGSDWTTSGVDWPDNGGPVTIGAYGRGIKPDALGICRNAPLIKIISVKGGGYFCILTDKQDWRFSDLHFVDKTRVGTPFTGASDMQRILFQRIRVEGFKDGIGWGHYNTKRQLTIDQMVVSECHAYGSEENVVYAGSERFGLLGNIFKNARISHVVRVWQAYLGVISHNIISGSSLKNDHGRHALKLHTSGSGEHGRPAPGTINLEHETEFVVVSDNVFGSSGPWPVTIGPTDAWNDGLMSDVIFEGNRIHADYGLQSSVAVYVGLQVWASNVSVRNNIIDGTGGAKEFTGMNISQRGREPAHSNVRIYNNTIYRQDEAGATTDHVAIIIGPTMTDTIVRNNLVHFPSGVKKTLIHNQSADLIESNNLLTGRPGFIDPNNKKPLLRNFSFRSRSPAIGRGARVPVYIDFNSNKRSNSRFDLGAHYYTGHR